MGSLLEIGPPPTRCHIMCSPLIWKLDSNNVDPIKTFDRHDFCTHYDNWGEAYIDFCNNGKQHNNWLDLTSS